MSNQDRQNWQAEKLSQNYYADYKPFNFVDGEGVRNSLYVSGCLFNCPSCYNKVAQDFSYGQKFTEELAQQIIADTKHSYVQGLTLLGGEPFLNTTYLLPFLSKFRQEFGATKDIWCWSGYTWEDLQEGSADKQELLKYLDVLVDGQFKLSYKKPNLQFRGSTNQRIIDVQRSSQQGQVVIWDKLCDGKQDYEQIKKAQLI